MARGLAIVLVIAMHASAIPWMLGVPYPDVLNWIGAAAAPYRMPTLLVLSGILLIKSLRKGWWRYYTGKIQLIFWPLAVWLIIYSAVSRGGEKLTDISYWLNGGYLWFLIVIGCCYLIAPLVRVVPAWALAAVMAISSAPISEPFIERFLYYGAFFFVGAQLGQHLEAFTKITRRGRVLAGTVAIGWAIIVATFGIAVDQNVWSFPLAVVGVLAIMLGLQKVGDNPATRFLGWVGRHSIVFYVAHFPIIMIVCYAFFDNHVYDPWLIPLVGTMAAILGSIALVQIRHTTPFNWLFEMPTPSRQDWQRVKNALRTRPHSDEQPTPVEPEAAAVPRATPAAHEDEQAEELAA